MHFVCTYSYTEQVMFNDHNRIGLMNFDQIIRSAKTFFDQKNVGEMTPIQFRKWSKSILENWLEM